MREYKLSDEFLSTGVPTAGDLKYVLPPDERLERGPCVVVECFQRIPCNPCTRACPSGAIKIEGNINNLPEVDFDKCTGCGVCIAHCPGLCIFVVHKNYTEKTGRVMIPYEFLPVPEKGEIVDGLNRAGEKVCDAKVLRVINNPKQDKTLIIDVEVPKNLINEVRMIKVRR